MNHTNTKYYLFCLIAFIGFQTVLIAQPGTTSEAEVQLQADFIEASRDRILGNFEDAIRGYQKVIKADNNNHAAAYELARVYDVTDKNEEALKYIKMAVDLDEENMWYRMFLADVYQKMQNFDDAVKVFEQLVKENPNEEYHYYKLAFCMVKAKENNDALKMYDQIEKKFGINEELIRRKHTLHMGMGNHKKAAIELEKLVAAYPSYLEYYHLLADFYEDIGDQNQAKVVYEKIQAIDPNDAKAAIALTAKGPEEGGSDVTYLNTLKPIFQSDQNIDVKVKALIPYVNKVADFKDPNLAAKAIELAEILVENHPDEAKSHSVYADLLYHSEEVDKALVEYQKTVDLDDSVFAVWEQIMYIHIDKYEMEKLVEVSDNAIDAHPNKGRAYYLNGVGNIELGKQKDAVPMLEQALMMSGRDVPLQMDILAKLGVVYSEMGKYDKAASRIDKALSAKADYGPAQVAKAWMFYQQADYKEAKTWIEKAIKNGGNKDAATVEKYGDILFKSGDKKDALKQWQMAEQLGGQSAELKKKISSGTL